MKIKLTIATILIYTLAGYDNVMSAYRFAVEQRMRFFSYGDAMLITRKD